MSHAYAARASRQTAVFTAIVGFHFVLFLVITMGLVPRVFEKEPGPVPITVLPPEKEPKPVLEQPAVNLDGLIVGVTIDEPDVRTPEFNETVSEPAPTTDAAAGGDAGTAAPYGEYVAPRVHVRSGSLAALIDSCYPAASRRLNEEGRVVAQVVIGTKGAALNWSVAQSSGFPRLDAAAACVLGKLEFVAGRRDGQAVAAEAMLPIVFRLD
jgi:protein TonB